MALFGYKSATFYSEKCHFFTRRVKDKNEKVKTWNNKPKQGNDTVQILPLFEPNP